MGNALPPPGCAIEGIPGQPILDEGALPPSFSLAIDGDILAYRAAATVEKETKWDSDLWTLHSTESEGMAAMQRQLDRIRTALGVSQDFRIVFALSSGQYFRKDIFPDYKANRKEVRKPIILKALKERLHTLGPVLSRDGLEGDDILGLLMTRQNLVLVGPKVQVSIDKDQRQIPGLLYNAGKHILEHRTIHQANHAFLSQVLTGDVTDGYPGLPGCGPVSAEKVLGPEPQGTAEFDVETAWAAVVAAYEKKGFTADDAILQARCARLLRARDYDFDNKKPILWTPKLPAKETAECPPKSNETSSPSTPRRRRAASPPQPAH